MGVNHGTVCLAISAATPPGRLPARKMEMYTWHADPAPPRLAISRLQGQVLLSWSAPSSFVLQQSAEPTSTNWTLAPAQPHLVNGTYQALFSGPFRGDTFFRLKNQ